MLRTPLKYPGGKVMLASKLVSLIPRHLIYVEVFGGAAALLFAKPPSKVEVYNDIDSNVVNFFRVLRDKFDEFYKRVLLTPYSREEFYFCRDNLNEDGIDDVERARMFFVLSRQSYGGNLRSWGYTFKVACSKGARVISSYLAAIDLLPEISQRLMMVQIENRDFREIIRIYDSEDTFFYLDPPYVLSSRRDGKAIYKHEMTDDDHRQLVEILLGIKGKFMLSGYYNEIYSVLEENGCKRLEFEVVCNLAGTARKGKGGKVIGKTKSKGIDCVWLNYEPSNLKISGVGYEKSDTLLWQVEGDGV